MKLALVEFGTKNHYPLIYNWLAVAELNGWEVILFTTKEIYDATSSSYHDLPHEKVLFDKMNFFDFIAMKKKLLDYKADQIIFLTMQSKFLEMYFMGFSNLKYGVTVHNTNVWFKESIVRKPSHIIKRFIRHKIRKHASFFIVNSQNMYESALQTDNVKKPILIMPFSLKRSLEKDHNETDTFTVVYPGSLNIQRKKYLNFIKLAIDNPQDRFIILGAVSHGDQNKDIYDQLKNIKNVKLYETFVSVNEFNTIMKTADLLFSELVTAFDLTDMSETYGQTKDSGISYLMIEYILPCLLNSEFQNLPLLENGSLYFSDYTSLQIMYEKVKNTHYRNTIVETMKNDLSTFTIEYFAKEMLIMENF